MFKKTFFRKIFLPYLFIIFLSLVIFSIFLANIFKDFYLHQTEDDLKHQAKMIVEDIKNSASDSVKIYDLLSQYYKTTSTRITIIGKDGRVKVDSKGNAKEMDNHSDRKEVIEALKGNDGYDIRKSYTLNSELMYVAIPIKNETGLIDRIVRTSMPIDSINEHIYLIRKEITGISTLIFLTAAIAGYIFSSRIRKSIEGMKSIAEKYAEGDFSMRAFSPDIDEFKSLAISLNAMARQLDEKIKIIEEQKNLQTAVLASMKEGIIAVDNEEKILLLNEEARLLLYLYKDVTGKSIQEAIRIPDIHTFIRRIIKEGSIEDTTVIYSDGKEIYMHLTGAYLNDALGKVIGAIVVLTDMTSAQRLDSVKRNLVANVSHELKTPVTAIKGFVETLIDGAMNEEVSAKKFLHIIHKNVERLNFIIDDLLSLSKIEQYGASLPDITEENIRGIINSVMQNFTIRAAAKNIIIKYDNQEDIILNLNKSLFEQAISNLLDNAIKYSSENKIIIIKTEISDNTVRISVKDEGIGIEEKYFDRIFERFYRVEKSRARDEGGTGLGLAIVKHIAQAHGGKVDVKSELGKGSKFSIIIPLV